MPIIGWGFKLTGQNYDLCEAEFNQLPDAEKKRYEKIRAADSVAPRSEVAVHAWRSPTPSSAGGEGRVCDAGMWPARQRQSGPAMQAHPTSAGGRAQVSRDAQPPLPGGHTAGEKVCYVSPGPRLA